METCVILLFILFFVGSDVAVAQISNEVSAYKQQLQDVAYTLQTALDAACCNASGRPDAQILAEGYQTAYLQAEEARLPLRDTDAPPLFGPLLDSDLYFDLEQGVEVPQLDNEMRSTLKRLQVVITQIDEMANDQLANRLESLEGVFSRPEFQEQLTLWERFIRWINRLLEQYLPQPEGGSAAGGIIGRLVGWFLAIAGAVGLVILLSYWIQRLVGGFVHNASVMADPWADDYPITARQAREQAAEQAQSGNYRGAVRRLYLAALLTMEEQGKIRYDRSQTNHEVLAQLDSDEDLANHLRPIVETFDDVWYGIQEPDQETFSSYTQEVDHLTEAATETNDAPRVGINARGHGS